MQVMKKHPFEAIVLGTIIGGAFLIGMSYLVSGADYFADEGRSIREIRPVALQPCEPASERYCLVGSDGNLYELKYYTRLRRYEP